MSSVCGSAGRGIDDDEGDKSGVANLVGTQFESLAYDQRPGRVYIQAKDYE